MRAALILLLLAAPVAAADAEAEAQVARLGQVAVDRFAAGDHVAALQAFRDAESWLAKLPARQAEMAVVRFNIGRCLLKLGRADEALATFRSVTASDLPERTRAGLSTRISALEEQLFGTVEVRCEGAIVELRGLDVSQPCGTPWRNVAPGRYQVVATWPDGVASPDWAEVVAGQTISLSLARPPKTAPVAAVVVAPAPPPPTPSRTLEWSLTAAAGALLVGGVVTHVLAMGALDDEQTFYERWRDTGDAALADESQAAADEAQVLAVTTYTLYGLAGAAAIGAAVAWSMDDEGPQVAVAPGGVVIRARW